MKSLLNVRSMIMLLVIIDTTSRHTALRAQTNTKFREIRGRSALTVKVIAGTFLFPQEFYIVVLIWMLSGKISKSYDFGIYDMLIIFLPILEFSGYQLGIFVLLYK